MLDEEACISKVPYLYGEHGSIYGRHKREGRSALPGEASRPARELLSSRGDRKGFEESAEGKVSSATEPKAGT